MSLIIDVKVIPSSGRTGCSLDGSMHLKVYLKSAPEHGKANAELIKYFAQLLDVPQAAITLIAGASSRRKKLKINLPLTFDELISRLGFAVQKNLLNV